MLRSRISNFMLSRVNIDHAKNLLSRTPILNTIYKVGAQSLIDPHFPTHVFIETTRACNLACTCCPRTLKASEKGHMEYGLFTKVVDEVSSHGTRNFSLHMLGEPLLHPKIVDMVAYIKARDPKHSILLTTNGYFLDDKKAQELIDKKLDKITFSMFSFDPEKNKKLTGKDGIERVIRNIKAMKELQKKSVHQTKMSMRVIVSEDNIEEVPRFQAFTNEIGIFLELRYTHNFSGVIKTNFIEHNKDNLLPNRYPCYHLWFSPAVTWDGKIVMCCVDWKYSEILGDIREVSLGTVWRGDRMKQLREYHLKGEYSKIPICAGCNVWSTYPDIFFKIQKG